MKLQASKFTEVERLGLRMMAANLRDMKVTHPLTTKLACLLNTVSHYQDGQALETELLNEVGNELTATFNKMNGREQYKHKEAFAAAQECMWPARSIGENLPETFADNLKLAAQALQAAQHVAHAF